MTRSAAASSDEQTDALSALFADSETITATQLTSHLSELRESELSAKTVRAYLRRIAARDQATLKNQRWGITREIAENAIAHFVKVAASE